LSSVRGMANIRVATEKMRRKYIAQSPLLDKEDKACCPDNNSAPCFFCFWSQHLCSKYHRITTYSRANCEDDCPNGEDFSENGPSHDHACICPTSQVTVGCVKRLNGILT
jgi:hypothetical protein